MTKIEKAVKGVRDLFNELLNDWASLDKDLDIEMGSDNEYSKAEREKKIAGLKFQLEELLRGNK